MEYDYEIIDTCIYGTSNSNRYDMKEKLGNKLLNYKLSKIRCQVKSNKSIYGIQFIYQNINNGKEEALLDISSKENDLIEQEYNLNNEEINDLRVWLSPDFKLRGFEISTNKNHIYKFGFGEEEELIKIPDFEQKDQIIVGFGCYFDENEGIISIYGQYINYKKYIFAVYSGIFLFRIKIKDQQFKEEVEKKLANMNEKYKVLYRICQLPDNQFFNVLKYSFI